MREYRGKRIDFGEWVYGSFTHCQDGNGNPTIIPLRANYHVPVNPDTVGQYIGIADDQEVKIYDGDKVMVILTGNIYTVGWDELGAGYLFFPEIGDGGIDYYEFADIASGFGFRVVGNRWDHPHLLGEDDKG